MDDILLGKGMDDFVSIEEDFEEDAMFDMQPVEVDKKRRCQGGTRDFVYKSGCTILDLLESSYEGGVIQEAVEIIKTRCDKSISESFTDSPRKILSNTSDVIEVLEAG